MKIKETLFIIDYHIWDVLPYFNLLVYAVQ